MCRRRQVVGTTFPIQRNRGRRCPASGLIVSMVACASVPLTQIRLIDAQFPQRFGAFLSETFPQGNPVFTILI
jgi:hypothetical protein